MAEIKLFNTLSRQIEIFKPAKNGNITLYTCGPTVYDFQHVGNWRTYVVYDTLKRTLMSNSHEVNHVLNITDVGHLVSDEDEGEDKLVKTAKKERKTAWEVAKFYSDDFIAGLKKMNIIEPTHMPRATDYIQQQVAFVQRLEAKGFTYQIDDGIYFDTSLVPDYGKLAKLDKEQLKAGARVEFNPQKRNVTDFALWKLSANGEKRDMEWDSPWGKGFPGWHLECSVMAESLLGITLDIHAGGIDHIPVHHTNEIAQSEAANGAEFARYWLHVSHLMIDGAKIAKSAGNGYTLQDIAKKGYGAMALRLMYLQSNYKTQANFSWENLDAAQNRLSTLKRLSELRWQTISKPSEDETELIVRAQAEIARAMSNDLDTPNVLKILSSLSGALLPTGISAASAVAFNNLLDQVDELLGLMLVESTPDISAPEKQLMVERQTAREQGDFKRSDELRDQLIRKQLELDDTSSGALWHRA